MIVELPVVNHNGLTTINGEKLNSDIEKGKRIFPWETGTDGFFIAKLKKIGKTISPERSSFTKKNVKLLPADHKDVFKKRA